MQTRPWQRRDRQCQLRPRSPVGRVISACRLRTQESGVATELFRSFPRSWVGRLGPEGTTAWTKVPWFDKIGLSETVHIGPWERLAAGDFDARLHSCSLLKPRFAGGRTGQSDRTTARARSADVQVYALRRNLAAGRFC